MVTICETSLKVFAKPRVRFWLRCPRCHLRNCGAGVGDANVPGGHADSFTTAIALALWPHTVRRELIPGPSRVPQWDREALNFTDFSDSGVIGDARFGSAELGRKLHADSVAWLAGQIEGLS